LRLTSLLLAVELLDELYAGIPAVGAPGIQENFAVSYEGLATTLLVVPGLAALLLEPLIFLLADRYPRRWFVTGGLAAMATSALGAALAPGPIALATAISVAFVASGAATALAQATLADAHADDREGVMTRWAFFGEIGDLAAPALFALLAALSLGWRDAYGVVSALCASLAFWVWRRPFPAVLCDDDDDPGLWAGLRAAIGNRRLWVWLAACFTCELLDEIFVVFAALRLRDDLGADVSMRSLALGAWVAGGVLGLLVVERFVRDRPLRVLVISSTVCAAAYVAWLIAPDLPMAIVALFVVGATVSPLYPIAIAQAYAALPGRSGAVHAAGHLFTPLTLALPWLLGVIADRHGATATLAILIAQPVAMAAIGLGMARRR
jgi:predicted MFS family arabinose efflux permease